MTLRMTWKEGVRDWGVFVRTALLRFSQTRELWSSKVAFTIAFFAALNYNYDHKQRILTHRNTQNGSKSTPIKSQSMTFWTRWSKLRFPKRSAKIIDDSENLQRQLVFELHNSLFSFLKSVVTKFTTEAVWNLVLTTGGSLSSPLSSSYKFQHPMYYVRKAISAELKEKPSLTLLQNFLLKRPLLTNTSLRQNMLIHS